jgi:two-component sensor histidine kinase
MSEGFVLCEAIRDEKGQLVDYWLREANPAFLRRMKAGRQILDQRMTELVPGVSRDWFQACDEVLRTGEPVRFERRDPLSERWYDVHMTRISDTELAQIFVDVTDRKRAEGFQSDLFTELNHRVKNNLAIVSGLLTMQARNAERPDVRDQLLQAVDRIQSIADVHTSLFRKGSKGEVDFGAYLTTLCERISRSLLEGGRIQLNVQAQSATVPLAQAVPLGVVVNELVTNAVKHAYPSPAKGAVLVTFKSSPSGLVLTVFDRGKGVPETVTLGAGGLGMRLVRSIVRQLGGELSHNAAEGACFEVRVPSCDQTTPTQGELL